MGLGSVILGVFAFLCMFAGALLVWVPFLGTMLSFLAPILAIAGVILGGVAMSRAREGQGESEGLAIGGLILNVVAFIPAMLIALTCGLCNTLCTSAYVSPNGQTSNVPWTVDAGPHSNPFEDLFADAGVRPTILPPPITPPIPSTPLPPGVEPPPTTPAPMQREGDQTPLPPPPLPPGPHALTANPHSP